MTQKKLLAEILKENIVLLDGGTGSQYQLRGATEASELLNFTRPDIVKDVSRSYISAGSRIFTTNTFGCNRLKLEGSKYTTAETVKTAVALALEARGDRKDVLVALDIGPLGRMLQPVGDVTFEEAYDIFSEIVSAGAGADLVLCETMSDLLEIKAAVLAVKENSDLPVIASLTFEPSGRTFTGCTPAAAAITLQGLGVSAVGVNCSLGPKDLFGVLKEMSEVTQLPLMLKANAGLPDPVTNTYGLAPAEFAAQCRRFLDIGVKFFGGCCGTTPAHIKELARELRDAVPAVREVQAVTRVCSSSRVCDITRPRIIGERLNPTGKKDFKEALKAGDFDYIAARALEQVRAGADILDVNVGLPEIDERATMVRVVKMLAAVTDTPLQIDSTRADVIEAALRVYGGKAIVNSVNGETAVLERILPVVKKYGAAVIGLTLDADGIPPKAEARVAIAEKILDKCLSYGIPRGDVIIDCLTLTASAQQSAVLETLNAVEHITKELGLKTVLGVSNISFGLPERELLNSTFLTMALDRGLSLAIINPNSLAMTEAIRAHALLAGFDVNSAEFIAAHSGSKTFAAVRPNAEITVSEAIRSGLKTDAAKLTEKLLAEGMPPLDIVDNELVPTLDKIGLEYEKGKLFLPQLILSAETAGICFDVIKKAVARDGKTAEEKGTIVLATVRGDIHDIGKNIVKVLLDNYGYRVVDLGKDVPPSDIAAAVAKHDSTLVGLSALMTTTLPAMESTVKLLKQQSPHCRVMVGGAVLTHLYADMIGADYYGRDAKSAVDIAKAHFGK